MENRLEILSPDDTGPVLAVRLSKIKNAILAVEKFLKKSPEGTLYARKSHGSVQFFCENHYIHKKESQLITQLAQKKYFLSCNAVLKKQAAVLEKAAHELEKSDISKVYDRLPELVKPLVSPLTLSDAEYARQWLAESYGGNCDHELTGGLFTSGGVRVRSKSEVIIGNVLHENGVPFRYEFPVDLKRSEGTGIYTAHPDFYCLNVRTRQEFVWEHFGLMDDADYVEKMVRKLADFQKSGWFYGKNMIFTLETGRQQLNTRLVGQLVQQFLL